jgi:hypothetical protein
MTGRKPKDTLLHKLKAEIGLCGRYFLWNR